LAGFNLILHIFRNGFSLVTLFFIKRHKKKSRSIKSGDLGRKKFYFFFLSNDQESYYSVFFEFGVIIGGNIIMLKLYSKYSTLVKVT